MPKYNLERHYARASALAADKGAIDFRFCLTCQFVFNHAFDPGSMDYSIDYEASRSHSEYFQDYLGSVCAEIQEVLQVGQRRVVEVGCGDGEFLINLRKLVEFDGQGVDPGLADTDSMPSFKNLRFECGYYDASFTDEVPDVIILDLSGSFNGETLC